jgi:arylsulfatase A-like enzyme
MVLDELERSGRLESTLFVFLSDHGELLFDHGFCGKEERHYDACVRVPLMVAGPGFARGAVCDEIVQLEDVCPTVLDVTCQQFDPMPKTGPHLKMDAAAIPQLPGRSLRDLCGGEVPSDRRDAAYCESYNAIWSADPGDWARTIVTKRHRYTFYPRNGEQLFDLAADPGEQQNLVADASHRETKAALRDQLMELIVMQDYPKTRRELWAFGVH